MNCENIYLLEAFCQNGHRENNTGNQVVPYYLPVKGSCCVAICESYHFTMFPDLSGLYLANFFKVIFAALRTTNVCYKNKILTFWNTIRLWVPPPQKFNYGTHFLLMNFYECPLAAACFLLLIYYVRIY